ncbi:MAG: hypothetical protein IIT73_08415, partial [Treponema sp.]|nr:hypothetical protein [Treponema sp.]
FAVGELNEFATQTRILILRVFACKNSVSKRKLATFCTNSQKDMFKELSVNPYIDLCGSRLMENEIDTAWIRMSARVVFEENLTVKKMIMEKSSIVRQLYKNDANHSLFKVFYLSEISGSLNNLGHVKGLEENKAFSKPVVFNL